MTVAVLFARADSVYKTLPGVDVYDIERDARTYDGPWPVVAHPPCRAWGRLRAFANPRPDERNLGRLAVAMVREFGGVLEHPAGSTLWPAQRLPRPGERDAFGGWTLAAPQKWWGHKAEKETWFYVVGCEPRDQPDVPLILGEATHVVQSRKREDYRPHITKAEREHTPPRAGSVAGQIGRPLCADHQGLTMTTPALNDLITAALQLADTDAVSHAARLWKSEGGRACPIGWEDCSQAVYVDLKTGEYDYGKPGGPGHADCVRTCSHGMNPPPPDEFADDELEALGL